MISSRTPEGEPNLCPVCGQALRLEPSRPPGDAPCPACGCLLWFPTAASPGPSTQPKPASRQGQSAPLRVGDRVRITEGTFAAMEGRVNSLGGRYGMVRIVLTIFGKPVPVELEPNQVQLVS